MDFFSLTLSTIQVLCFLKEWASGYVNQRKSVEDLYGEIDGILVVLNRMKDLPNCGRHNSSVLEIPLRQCNRKCEELKKLAEGCTAHAHGNRRSMHDFVMLKWKDKDISDFRSQLNTYKTTLIAATLTILMGNDQVNGQQILEIQRTVNASMADLRQGLDGINRKLNALPPSNPRSSAEDLAERSRLLEEQADIVHCMDSCNAFIKDLNSRACDVLAKEDGIPSARDDSASTMTANAFQEAKSPIEKMLEMLGKRLERAAMQLEANDLRSQLRVQEHCNYVAERKRVDLQNVTSGRSAFQNFHPGDADLEANRVHTGDHSTLTVGNLSDEALQAVLANHLASQQCQQLGTQHIASQDELVHFSRLVDADITNKSPVVTVDALAHTSCGNDDGTLSRKTISIRWTLAEIIRSVRLSPKSRKTVMKKGK